MHSSSFGDELEYGASLDVACVFFNLFMYLFFFGGELEGGAGLDVAGVGEHVEGLHACDCVVRREEAPRVPRLRGRVARDIDDAARPEGEERVEEGLRPPAVTIRVSFSTLNSVVSSPIRTIERSHDSHGPCLFSTRSIVLAQHLSNHAQNPTEFSTELDAARRASEHPARGGFTTTAVPARVQIDQV